MTDKAPESEAKKAFRRFLSLLPDDQDLELTILKGHLLMEEQVRLIVERRLPNSAALGTMNNFAAVLRLARALYPSGHEPVIWSTIERLNTLRNEIAHRLDEGNRAKKMQAVIDAYPNEFDELAGTLRSQFELVLWVTFVHLAAIAQRAKGWALNTPPEDDASLATYESRVTPIGPV